MIKEIEKILVVKLRAIGDVVLSTIVLENLRSAFPAARIDFLTEDYCKEVVLGNPILNKILVFDRHALAEMAPVKRFRENLKFVRDVRNQQYDLVFDFFGNPRSAFLTWVTGAKVRVGYDYRVRKNAYTHIVDSRANTIHEAEWHLDALRALDIPIVERKLNFEVGRGSRKFAESFWQDNHLHGEKVVALNFSGGWPTKKWPIDRFAHLADVLIEKYNTKILILWGPGEREMAAHLAKLITNTTLLIPETNLKQLAAILEKVDFVVTTDSGPMHIAAAMGTPCVALFGPTNYHLQGPFGDFHEIVARDGLDCLGCNRTSCDNLVCMNTLTVEYVLEAVDRCITSNSLFS